jgi:hypothetical protein
LGKKRETDRQREKVGSCPNPYHVEALDSIKPQITQTSSAESHSEFLLKTPNPLWQNPYFLSKIKTLILQKQVIRNEELRQFKQLKQEGLLEDRVSPWACRMWSFLCNKPEGHFARTCPNKKREKPLSSALYPDLSDEDSESVFSLDDDPWKALLAIGYDSESHSSTNSKIFSPLNCLYSLSQKTPLLQRAML